VGVEESPLGADSSDHGDGLTSLVRQLNAHPFLEPHS
jgi:hypothetical protein